MWVYILGGYPSAHYRGICQFWDNCRVLAQNRPEWTIVPMLVVVLDKSVLKVIIIVGGFPCQIMEGSLFILMMWMHVGSEGLLSGPRV